MPRRQPRGQRITLGADKAHDVTGFVETLRSPRVTPHIAIDGHPTKTGKRRKTAIDRRPTRHSGYAASQRRRNASRRSSAGSKRAPGGGQGPSSQRLRVGWMFTLATTADNLVRLPRLLEAAA